MDTIMSFMDKIYSDTKTLTIIYIVGAVLLLIFIIMLIVSLRKPSPKKMKTKILDEPKINKEQVDTKEEVIKEENKETDDLSASIEDKKEDIVKENITPIEEEQKEIKEESVEEKEENPISKALDNVENKDIMNTVEEKEEIKPNVSAEIPDVDEFVDNVVKKTYEKNEQFSSVFVGNNTSTIKLDKVLEDLNVDEDIKVDIVPDDEKTIVKEEPKQEEKEIEEPNVLVETEPIIEEVKEETVNTPIIPEIDPVAIDNKPTAADLTVNEPKENSVNGLEDLKKAMEEKKKEVNLKQDELKSKLAGLKTEKKEDVMKAEDLLNKLNSMKSE